MNVNWETAIAVEGDSKNRVVLRIDNKRRRRTIPCAFNETIWEKYFVHCGAKVKIKLILPTIMKDNLSKNRPK